MKQLFTYLFALVVSVAALSFSGCNPSSGGDKIQNSVVFSSGATVTAATASQFMMVTSAESWQVELLPTEEGGDTEWCSLSQMSGSGNANIRMIFGKNTTDHTRSLMVSVRFGLSAKIELVFAQRGQTTDVADEHPAWLELPAGKVDNADTFVSYNMLPSSSGTKRSFTLYYDASAHIPLWVAYPLCSYYITTGNRTNDWNTYDPNIPSGVQVSLSNAYYGYQRGHMLPSASRNKTTSDNKMTFYNTNMTPQLGSLNTQYWATLEEKVRSCAKSSDTLYVVTGAVLRTVGGNESIDYTTTRSDAGKQVAIPNYYYKALLRLSLRTGTPTYSAVAAWVEHRAKSGDVTADDMITIDELERRTGIDFFANLDEETQNAVESSWTAADWGL